MAYSNSKYNNNSSKFYEALSIISKIENKINLEDYISQECDVVFKRASYKEGMPVLMCNCPIHEENTPSFALYTYNQTFHCFSCKQSGGLINFVQQLKGWTWLQTINFFANKLNISHSISEQDVLDSLENQYNKYQKSIDKYNFFNVNFEVSKNCRLIKKEYGHIKEISDYIEKIYAITDRAIIKKDKSSMFKIKEEALPVLMEKIKDYKLKEEKIKEINLNHLGCKNCFLIHQNNNIILGDGKITARVMIISENPRINSSILKDIIYDLGYNPDDIYLDYIYNCIPQDKEAFYFKEGILCCNNWLRKKINIINPKSIMILGERAAKIFLKNDNISLDSYFDLEIKYENLNVNFNYSIDDIKNHDKFIKRLSKYLKDNIDTVNKN